MQAAGRASSNGVLKTESSIPRSCAGRPFCEMRWQIRSWSNQAIVPVKIAPPIVSSPHPDTDLSQEIHIKKGEMSISFPCSLPAAYILEIIKGLA